VFKIEEYFAKNMVRPSFPIIVASGPNSANPHHISSKRKIVANDVILMDLGCVYKGYCSDLTRTFFLGKTNDLQRKVYALVKRAYGRAMRALKKGVKASSIDNAAREVISNAGFADKFIHTTGHGVGIDIHEPPRLSAKDNTVLKNGMIVTVEPGVYIKGRFGVRIEDTVLINKKGKRVLTQ
jgi:Xaa-Pro aminopeptidase